MKTLLIIMTALCAISTSTVLFWKPYSPPPSPPSPPQQLNASVMLTKWQVHKMLNSFEEDDHMSEMRVFNSVVKNSADGWRISSTHLVRNPKSVVIPASEYHVIDASYIDFSGNHKQAVEYAASFREHHDYIVVSLK